MWKPFNKKNQAHDFRLGEGKIIKIHAEIRDTIIPFPNEFRLLNQDIIGKTFICLQSYDDTVIFIPQKIFDDTSYNIFEEYAIKDESDNKYLINISRFIQKYKIYSNTLCRSSDTVVPTFIDICKIYTCKKDKAIICIYTTDHISKTDDIYKDLSELRQIKSQLHI